MKIVKIITFLAFVFVIGTFLCSNSQKTEFSEKALKEKITSIDAHRVSFQEVLNQYKGKPIVMEVWASWCGDCVKAMPQMKELQAKNPDVTYLFLSMDKTVDKWKTGIEKYQIKGNHYLVNGGMRDSFGKALDLDWIPRYIVIDKNGKIVLYRAIETDFEKINTTLKSLN
jgi:thiol-disulfide isomerase/thioredoxin